jgi:hypothetical protein
MTAGPPDASLRAIAATIEQAGVYLQFEPQPTPLETSWYTVGLTGHGHPELIMFGLPPDLSRPALRALAADLIAGRRTVGAGRTVDDVLEGHPVTFVAVTEPDRHLPVAAQFYAGTGMRLRALQIVWPDRYHRWPWQPGTRVQDMPVLGEHALDRLLP